MADEWHPNKLYNTVAKVMREEWPAHHTNNAQTRAATHTHVSIALNFAKRFKDSDPQFDPLSFLDHCSPDPDLYPLSELWEVAP
jgi:hypothetical protein